MGYYLSKFLLYAPDNNYDYYSGARCLHILSHLFFTRKLWGECYDFGFVEEEQEHKKDY